MHKPLLLPHNKATKPRQPALACMTGPLLHMHMTGFALSRPGRLATTEHHAMRHSCVWHSAIHRPGLPKGLGNAAANVFPCVRTIQDLLACTPPKQSYPYIEASAGAAACALLPT